MFPIQEKKTRYGNTQAVFVLNVTGGEPIRIACFATLKCILKQQNVLAGLSALQILQSSANNDRVGKTKNGLQS